MPEKHTRKSVVQKVIDQIIFNLTGESRSRRKHPIGQLKKKSVTSPPPRRRKKKHSIVKKIKFSLSRFFQGIVNPGANNRRKPTVIKIKANSPVFPASSEPVNAAVVREVFESRPVIRVAPVLPRQRKSVKKRSFLKRLFKGSKTRTEDKVFTTKGARDEFLKALPGEGFALFNSAGLYILAYLVIYLVYQLTGSLVASNFGIDSVLYYYELYFPIGNASPLWTRSNIIIITLASPFISVLISIILLKGVLVRQKLNPQLRLFLLWVAFHGATHFLGAFVAGIVTSQGFGYVANWMYMNVFFRILVSLVFLFLMTLTGYFSAGYVLETIPPGIRQQRWRLSLALGSRLIIPWLMGGFLIMIVKYPNAAPQHGNITIYDAVIIATMGFLVIPAFFNFKARARAVAERPSRHKRAPGILIFSIAVITLILFRLFLEKGLHLLIQFNFDVGFYH